MNRLLVLGRGLRLSTFAVLCWLGSQGLAWAQAGGAAPAQNTEAKPPAYVAPYALVIVCIGVGLAIVLNSSRRRDRAKPEVFGEP
jgi:hypothetical protein